MVGEGLLLLPSHPRRGPRWLLLILCQNPSQEGLQQLVVFGFLLDSFRLLLCR